MPEKAAEVPAIRDVQEAVSKDTCCKRYRMTCPIIIVGSVLVVAIAVVVILFSIRTSEPDKENEI
jgi:hypothetical protein